MITIAIITISDRSSRGEREDLSAPEIQKWAELNGYTVKHAAVVPDEIDKIKERLIEYSGQGIDLILTSGGTGCGPRDVTPEATSAVIERNAPGFAETMRIKSSGITHHAMLSRAVSGIRGRSLIINMPGSPKAVRESLSFIEKAIPHAVDSIKGNVSDCGSK